MIEASEPEKSFAVVNGQRMAYVETGEPAGPPVVFLHGNPTSSYLWRNVWPHVADLGRVIAPDLIGMGASDKLSESGPDRYRFVEHRDYLDGLLDALDARENVTLVIHDWGSALGFDWANRHRDAVRGVCYMEGIVRPVTWAEWPEPARKVFQGFRSEAGEAMVLENNLFIEGVVPGSILRKLSAEEMNEYRRPFVNAGEDRRPTLTWPREIPIEGEPADVVEIVQSYADWLSTSDVPKLFFDAEPGAILRKGPRDFCRTWPNQTEIKINGIHFVQEDSPDEIGTGVRDWLAGLA